MHPNLFFEVATTELRGEASLPMTWQRLFTAGRRALRPSAYKQLYDLMETENGRYLLAVVFTFVGGVILRPQVEHLAISEATRQATHNSFRLPDEYRVR